MFAHGLADARHQLFLCGLQRVGPTRRRHDLHLMINVRRPVWPRVAGKAPYRGEILGEFLHQPRAVGVVAVGRELVNRQYRYVFAGHELLVDYL